MGPPLALVACLALAAVKAVDVAIVGAGPCGLATAIALAKAPCKPTIKVYEKDNFLPKGASIRISTTGWRALRAIDRNLYMDVRSTATNVDQARVCSMQGIDLTPGLLRFLGLVLRFLFATIRRVLPLRPSLTKTHLWHDVRDVLLSRARQLLGADSIVGDKDLKLLRDDGNMTLLRFENEKGEEPEEVRCKIVLACDGVNSKVRQLCKEAPCLLDVGKSVWRGIAPKADSHAVATFYRGDGDISAVTFPAGRDGGISWTVIAPAVPGRSETRGESFSRLKCALPDAVDEELLGIISQSPTIIENKLVARDWSKPWESSRPGVAYFGDAAHPLRPTGEGTALAFEDAWALGWLAQQTSSINAGTLREYESARKERVRAISQATFTAAERFYKEGGGSLAPSANSAAAASRLHPVQYSHL